MADLYELALFVPEIIENFQERDIRFTRISDSVFGCNFAGNALRKNLHTTSSDLG